MVSLFDVIEDLMVLWIVLGIALIGLVAWLCYRFIPGLRIEKEEVDEKQAAKEELDRFLVPMDEDAEIKEETEVEFMQLENGLISNQKAQNIIENNAINLTDNIFKNDAIIMKNLKSNQVTLYNKKTNKKVL